MLPKSWNKLRDDKRSLCQMILNKVAGPVCVKPKSYWEAMLLGITNDKYCSLRSNFKQVMFEQFQGKLCNKIHVTYLFMLTSLWWLTLCLLQMTRIGDGLPQVITMVRFLRTQGYGHVILKTKLQHMIKWNIFCSFLTSMLVMLLVVIFFHNGVDRIAQKL